MPEQTWWIGPSGLGLSVSGKKNLEANFLGCRNKINRRRGPRFFASSLQPFPTDFGIVLFLSFFFAVADIGGKMASDEIIWQIINQQFCSFKLK